MSPSEKLCTILVCRSARCQEWLHCLHDITTAEPTLNRRPPSTTRLPHIYQRTTGILWPSAYHARMLNFLDEGHFVFQCAAFCHTSPLSRTRQQVESVAQFCNLHPLHLTDYETRAGIKLIFGSGTEWTRGCVTVVLRPKPSTATCTRSNPSFPRKPTSGAWP